ncbi:hypothetical protein LPJ61_006283, partial [Coemansia biformis]
MAGELTADQAAQRLLVLVDVLEERRLSPQRQKGSAQKHRLNASSISWAFHESADTTGLLRWIVDNVDARKNGLTSGELELLAHLERAGYSVDSSDDTARAVAPGFELAAQKPKVEARIARLELYTDTARSQGVVLANRADQMSRELAELQEEEERLRRTVRSSDTEVARLVTAYKGVLDEASLAAKTLEARLRAGAPMSPASSYFYQCAGRIAGLGDSTRGHLESLGRQLGEQLAKADKLPSPWRDFEPFATRSVSDLLALATEEHARISKSTPGLVAAKLELDIACRLVRAIGEEADKVRGHGSDRVLQRCQATATSGDGRSFDEQLQTVVSEHAARMAASVHERAGTAPEQPEMRQTLVRLNASCNELAHAQSAQVDRWLDAALGALRPHERAFAALLDALAGEREMLGGWALLWTTAAESLDRDNAALEKQR